MKIQYQEDIAQNIIKTLKEQNKHLLDRLEKAYDDKSELRRKLSNGHSNEKLDMKKINPTEKENK